MRKRKVLKERDGGSADDNDVTCDQSREKGDDGFERIYFSRRSRKRLVTGKVVAKQMPVYHTKWDCTSFNRSMDESIVRICLLRTATHEAERSTHIDNLSSEGGPLVLQSARLVC